MSRPTRGARPQGRQDRQEQGGAARTPGRRGPVGRASGAGAPGMGRLAARLEQLTDLLDQALTWKFPADAVLSHWLRAHPALGPRDRAEVAEGLYDVLRHLRRYRHYAQSGVGPAHRRLAILGLASTLRDAPLDAALSPPEQAWLAQVSRIDPSGLAPAVRDSLPDWLAERLSSLPEAGALAASLNQPAPLDLRINPLKTTREAVLAGWSEGPQSVAEAQATPYSPWGLRLQGRPAIQRWPLFTEGQIEVQDEGSQLAAALVAPRRGDVVIDYCAGAGGKSLLLGALMRSTGRLFALDVSATRLARAKPRFARSGLSNLVTMAISGPDDPRLLRLQGKAQRVLVDAPCSGLGTLRRNPDLKWRQNPESLADLRDTQASILREAARCVAPGGRLIYVTCSLLPEENEAQVDRFLTENPEFSRLDAVDILAVRCKNTTMRDDFAPGPDLVLRPDRHGTDGFYGAVLLRSAPAAADSAVE